MVEAYRLLQDPAAEAVAPAAEPGRPRAERWTISPCTALDGGEVVAPHCPTAARCGSPCRPACAPATRCGAGGAELLRSTSAPRAACCVRGDDLWMTVQVAPGTLKKGGRRHVETPLGRRAIWIDRKVAERGLVRLAGQGLPARGRRKAGDLFVRLEAAASAGETPAREMLRRFAAAWAAA